MEDFQEELCCGVGCGGQEGVGGGVGVPHKQHILAGGRGHEKGETQSHHAHTQDNRGQRSYFILWEEQHFHGHKNTRMYTMEISTETTAKGNGADHDSCCKGRCAQCTVRQPPCGASHLRSVQEDTTCEHSKRDDL